VGFRDQAWGFTVRVWPLTIPRGLVLIRSAFRMILRLPKAPGLGQEGGGSRGRGGGGHWGRVGETKKEMVVGRKFNLKRLGFRVIF
jgi:hypothetical protein